MTEDEAWALAPWDAVETVERLTRKEVSANEVLTAAVLRAQSATALNAIVTPTFERALAQQPAPGPLAGVPTFIKDLNQVAGVRTRWGSAATGSYISRANDSTVAQLEAIGLVCLGKSATPEFGLMATTESGATGACRNPWDLTRSPGGSSGGAAALVSAGVVPLAHASDGGGSIRIPAACCGLVGLKPSAGRLDMPGTALLPVPVAVEGVVTRSVRDTVLFWDALERRRARPKLAPIGPLGAPRRLRIGVYVEAPTGTPVDPENVAAAERAATLCRDLGHEVEAIACPFTPAQARDFMKLWAFLAFAQTRAGPFITHRGFDASKLERWSVEIARDFTNDVFGALAAIRRLRGFAARYAHVMESWDVLLSPTLGQAAPALGHLSTDLPYAELYAKLLAFTPFTALINAAAAPGLSLPLGRTSTGLPIGVQFTAARGQERTLLELGLALEAAAPWPRLAPKPGPR